MPRVLGCWNRPMKQGKWGSPKPALFMKVRRESVQTQSETGTRSREGLRHTRAVCRRAEWRDCPLEPRIRACSRRFMNNAG